MGGKELALYILGAANLLLGLSNAVRGKNGACVLNAVGFGACLYLILKGM